MPQSTNSRRDLLRLVLFTLAAWAVWALGRNHAKPGAAEAETTETSRPRSGFSKRRLATSLAFATLFFAGAAFTAGAGEKFCDVAEEVCDGVTSTNTQDSPVTPPPTPVVRG